MFYRTATLWFALLLMFAGYARAEIVEGTVAAVTSEWLLQINLPDGKRVTEGDSVQVLAEVPGVGAVPITTLWKVIGTKAGTATAVPVETPSGTPQVGYLARIDTQADSSLAAEPAMSGSSQPIDLFATGTNAAAPSPEAQNLYLAAEDLANSASPSKIAEATDLYRQAAGMDHPEAMSALGAQYSFGRGVKRDDATAVDWQGRAAQLGSPTGMLRLGLIHLSGRGLPVDAGKAADHIRAAADSGNSHAMFVLAMLYEDGDGVPSSLIEMVKWLETAAGAGHAESMFILGHIYLEGEDGLIPKDVHKAEDHWLAAANAGHAGAMKALAEFYEGEAVNAAKKWADAARTASPSLDYARDPRCLSSWECYTGDGKTAHAETTPEPSTAPVLPESADQRPKVIYTVQDCDRLAATPGDPDRPDLKLKIRYADLDPQRVISSCLKDIAKWPDTRRFYAQIARGYHKAGMFPKALEAAKTGARMGSGQAMATVGSMYKSGRGVPKNASEALKWFEKAGHERNVTGMHFAAAMHLHAQGVPYYPQAAARWYQTAAKMGNRNAFTNLGILYDNGEGVPYDPGKAARNLMKGLSKGAPQAKKLLLQNPQKLTGQTRVEIQRILRRNGLYTGALDGAFGPLSQHALKAWMAN